MRDSKKTVQVKNNVELENALKDDSIGIIELKSDITRDNLNNLNLQGKIVKGNIIINSNESGTLDIENGTIEGNITINTPNATVNNKAIVKGDAIIKDVSGNTFNNLGSVVNIIIEDLNISSLFNEGNITGEIKITKTATVPLVLKGNIDCNVNVESKSAKIKIDKDAKIKSLLVISSEVSLEVEGTITNLDINEKAEQTEIKLNKDSKVEAIKADKEPIISGEGMKNISQDKITGKASDIVKEEVKKVQGQPKEDTKVDDKNDKEKEQKEKETKEKQEQAEKEMQKKLADTQSVQKAKDSLNLNNVDNVTSNINLPKDINGVSITWESNNASVLDEKGNVIRPSATNGDALVTLTATLTKDAAKETKEFIVTVKAKDFTDEELVDKVLSNLKIEGKLDSVVDNLKLITKDDQTDVNIIWASSSEAVVSNAGVVTRTDKDEDIILTATLKKGSVTKTKKFNIKVKAKEKDAQEELKLIANSLEIPNEDNIEKDINLPTSLDGANITWKSNKESVISNTGKVTRPQIGKSDEKVTLTATISKNSKNETKDFTLIVKAEQQLVANNKQEFNQILKQAIIDCKLTVDISLPNYDSNSSEYNFDDYQNLLVEIGEMDFGKPGVKGSCKNDGKGWIMTVEFEYRKDVDEVKRQKEATIKEAKRVVSDVIKQDMTDFQKELALHDYIVKTADYNSENYKNKATTLEDHTAYGVLVNHIGVCESYAKAMNLLLKEARIDCKYVTGFSKNNGVKGGGHAWNMVKLGGEWYNLDATWDDPVSDRNGADSLDKDTASMATVNHTYFNIPDSIFNNDHIRGDFEEKNYPKCTATKYSYYNMDVDEYTADGKLIEKVTTKDELDEKILEAIKNKEKTLSLRIKDFKMSQKELSDEFEAVAEKNRIGGFSWTTSSPDDYHVNYTIKW
ncbi:immunoglobulin-like domain-containing protein [Clostridium cochlearium]